MARRKSHPSRRPAWLLGIYILTAFIVAIVLVVAIVRQRADTPEAVATRPT